MIELLILLLTNPITLFFIYIGSIHLLFMIHDLKGMTKKEMIAHLHSYASTHNLFAEEYDNPYQRLWIDWNNYVFDKLGCDFNIDFNFEGEYFCKWEGDPDKKTAYFSSILVSIRIILFPFKYVEVIKIFKGLGHKIDKKVKSWM